MTSYTVINTQLFSLICSIDTKKLFLFMTPPDVERQLRRSQLKISYNVLKGTKYREWSWVGWLAGSLLGLKVLSSQHCVS